MDHKGLNFFGSYLKQKGVITQEALRDAISFQEESNRRIGELARERGYLSKEQTEAIFQEQKRVDQPFGTIALKHKYLTRSQLDDLLFAQTVFSTHLGEALLIKGYLTPEQFSDELEAFREAQIKREHELTAFFNGLPEKDVMQAVVAAANRAYVRFGGRELKVDSICSMPEGSYEIRYQVSVHTAQKGAVTAAFFLSRTLAAEVVQGFLKDNGSLSEQDSLQRLNDFFVIVSRYLQMALAEQGLSVQEDQISGGLLDEPLSVPQDGGLVVQLVTPAGPMILHASVEHSQEKAPCADA